MQSFFIGVGAVVAGLLPWILAQAGVSNVGTGAGAAAIPDTVRYSFDIGAVVLRGRDAVDRASRRASIRPASCTDSRMPRRIAEGVDAGQRRARASARRAVAAVSASRVRCSSGISAARRQLYILCGLFACLGRWRC